MSDNGLSHCRDELSPLLFLARSARVYPTRTAVVDEERTFTYAQLAERVDALGRALRGDGIVPGDRVAALAPNRAELLEAHFGVPASGAVLCAINTRLSGNEIAQILAHSQAKLVLCDPGLRHLVPDDVRVIELGDEYEAFLAGAPSGALDAWPDNEERPISVNYTSGTTGRPKGVMYSHRGGYLVALEQVIDTGPRAGQPLPVDASDVPLQRLDVPVGGHRGGRHARLPAQGRAGAGLARAAARDHAHVRRSDGAGLALLARGRGPARAAAHDHDGRGSALADRDRADGGARRAHRPRLRADRDLRAVHDLRMAGRVERAARRGATPAEGPPGRAADDRRRPAGARRRRPRRARRRRHPGRDRDARERRDARLPRRSRGDGARMRRAAGSTRATAP